MLYTLVRDATHAVMVDARASPLVLSTTTHCFTVVLLNDEDEPVYFLVPEAFFEAWARSFVVRVGQSQNAIERNLYGSDAILTYDSDASNGASDSDDSETDALVRWPRTRCCERTYCSDCIDRVSARRFHDDFPPRSTADKLAALRRAKKAKGPHCGEREDNAGDLGSFFYYLYRKGVFPSQVPHCVTLGTFIVWHNYE